ncbi:hypothetical protein H0H93_009783 [Arthromyces matolae]|nr:hypothetical protein H0H93_009783 [Arthromyces matolae]
MDNEPLLSREASFTPVSAGGDEIVEVPVYSSRDDLNEEDSNRTTGELFDNVPKSKRQLGLTSVVFLIFNGTFGTGIYAIPSVILRTSGSVGVALIMWIIGALIAAAGTSVYLELGTGLPRSGGEKNYLEFIYRRPKFLTTCTFAVYVFITRSAAANSVVFGEYVVHALGQTPGNNIRLVALLCLTFCFLSHAISQNFGLRLQNTLGFFKLFVLSAIAISGFFCLLGVPGFTVREGYEKPTNFQWEKMWEGSGTGLNGFVTALYSVIWSFIGYQGANYVLSEVKDPIRTMKRGAPLAMLFVTLVYIFVNIAYFAAVSKNDILESRRTVVYVLFFVLYPPQD